MSGARLSLRRKVIPAWMLFHELVLIREEMEEAIGEDLCYELLAWQQAVRSQA